MSILLRMGYEKSKASVIYVPNRLATIINNSISPTLLVDSIRIVLLKDFSPY